MKTLFGYLKDEENKSGITSTYHIGLLQTKAFKFVMGTTSELIKTLGISNSDWVVLGTLYDHPTGLRSLKLAEIMSVEQPFITVLVDKLQKKGLLNVAADPTDKRAKIIHLTKEGKDFVKKTENSLSKQLEKISTGINLPDAISYLKVMQAIVDYSEKTNKHL